MSISSSEFRLPAGETQSDSGADGDSTIDAPLESLLPRGDQLRSTFAAPLRSTGPSAESGKVFGDFRIEERIGEGSMGEVYRATQLSLNRTVALKLLPGEFATNETLVERFLREMQSLAELDHPNIVRVLGTGEEDRQRFAAMEFIDGQSLQDWISELGRLPIGDVLHIGLVCATALQHSHDRKMIHRDIKPANVLLTRNGMCKIADFGLVKVVEADLSMTGSGTGLGTPEYMAPEQTYDARNVDGRGDIYSLGIMLYVLATGELPFKGKSIVEILSAKQRGTYQPMRALNSRTPERFDLILQKMLQAEPERRYADCAELITDLSSIGHQNATLSFVPVAEPERFVAYGPWSRLESRGAEKPAAEQRSSASSAPPDSGIHGPTDKLWYVAHKNKLGKSVLSKMMTNDLVQAVEKRLIPLNAQAKASPSEKFRPLSEFDEFVPTLKKLGVKIRPKALPPGVPSKSGQKKTVRRRKKKKNETLDLLLRIIVGLAAFYGLIRGGIDIAKLVRGPEPTEESAPGAQPSPASQL